jgi:hypothetical protein
MTTSDANPPDDELVQILKNAKLQDEEARILLAQKQHGKSDLILPEDQYDFLWNVVPESIEALKKHHPFIQVTQVYDENDPPPEYKLNFFTAESGWNVFDYGSAFAASRGEFAFGDGDFRIKLKGDQSDDDGDDRVLNPGKGTYINQAVKTAEELARLAVIRYWKAAEIYDADPLMAWAFWAEASYYGLAVFGFEPTAQDIAKRNRIKLSRRDLEDAIKEKRNIAQIVI